MQRSAQPEGDAREVMGFGRLGTDGVEGMFGSTREHTGHVADLPARLDLGILDVDGFDRA